MKREIVLGPLQMTFSSLCFAVMTYTAKLVSSDISGSETAFFRLLIGVVIALLLSFAGVVDLSSKSKKMLVARGVFGGAAVLLFFLALEHGTLTNSTVLNNTHPIFAAVISAVVLKEKLTPKIIACMVVAWAGIIMLIRPDVSALNYADMMALVSGILGGFAIASVRQLRKENVSSWTIFLYFCLFGMVASLIFSIPSWKWPSAKEYIFLLLTGIFGLLGQVTMTSAYKYCKTAVGGVLSMSTSVFSVFLGIMLLNERLSSFEFMGAILILAGSILTVWFEKPGSP